MMLNLVRIRCFEEPIFLSVGSILTQYVYNANAGLGTIIGIGGGTDIASMNANFGYEERPTITYMPIEGRNFAVRMLSPIPAETVFAAAKQGWAVDIFMYIGINRIGALENMAFDTIPFAMKSDQEKQYQQEKEKLKKFRQAVEEMIFLASNEAIEVQLMEENGVKVAFLVFADPAPKDTQSVIKEFKKHLGIAPVQNIFRITEKVTGVKEDEISIETRSLSAMMSFLAKGVQVPPEHLEDGRVIDFMISTAGSADEDLVPLRILSSKKRPENSFAAIHHLNNWFYIDNKDIDSKRSLGLLIALFRVLAPPGAGTAPLLTLPAG